MQFTDQLKRIVNLPYPPQNIISVVPSQTELLCDLGLEDKLTGVTKFCVHPKHIRKTKQIIGGTKKLHIEKIKQLQPQLIIANKEENEQKDILELEKFFPVWISDIKTFSDALEMIDLIGDMTDRSEQAKSLSDKITKEKNNYPVIDSQVRAAYLIWKDPYMAAGADTFIHEMLKLCGFDNVFSHTSRYPEINIEMLIREKPDIVLLSSEPFPFKEKHIAELSEYLPSVKILLADGEMFSWYGSRMQYAFSYFADLWKQLSD